MKSKCLSLGCENHRDAGLFVGDLCSPCHHMITTGKVHKNNMTFIGVLNREVERLRADRKDALVLLETQAKVIKGLDEMVDQLRKENAELELELSTTLRDVAANTAPLDMVDQLRAEVERLRKENEKYEYKVKWEVDR